MKLSYLIFNKLQVNRRDSGYLKYVFKPYLIRKYLSIRHDKISESENQQVRYGSRESRRPRFKGA